MVPEAKEREMIMGNRVVWSVCKLCRTAFPGGKKAKYCPDCRRNMANERTRSFLREHPGYVAIKMREYRLRQKDGIILQPKKSEAIHRFISY